jgi:hypothetical protein
MTEPTPPRILVKARLLPDLHARVAAYAKTHHRTMSSAVEHLVAIGLSASDPTAPATTDPTHTR